MPGYDVDDTVEHKQSKSLQRQATLPDGLPFDFWDDDEDIEPVSMFRTPLPVQDVEKMCPPGPGGLVWHAHLVADGTAVKPYRAPPMIGVSDFFNSLVQMDDGRWIFSGVLNSWTGLSCLELRSITSRVRGGLKTGLIHKIVKLWNADDEEHVGKPPSAEIIKGHKSVRVTLRAAPWSEHGWSADSPGFVFWYFAMSTPPIIVHGEKMLKGLDVQLKGQGMSMPQVVRVHLFGHRFAKKVGAKESIQDQLTYHTNILVEWDHGNFCSILELGNLNVVGACRGKSTWYPQDQHASLASAIPTCMQKPYLTNRAEIRCSDVPARTLDEFLTYVNQNSGPGKYFLDLSVQYSAPVRLTYRSQAHIMRYLLNYMGHDHRYSVPKRTCQHFAADFLGFLAGRDDIKTFSKALSPAYVRRSDLFLYDPSSVDMPEVEDDVEDHDLQFVSEGTDD